MREDLNYVYIDREKNITVEAIDNLLGIASIEYYVTDEILTIQELDKLNASLWRTFIKMKY